MDRVSLNVATNIESKPLLHKYYVIQALHNNSWSDVVFSRGDIKSANKKARYYRNKHDCETRVVEVRESISYSYEYEVTDSYTINKNKD